MIIYFFNLNSKMSLNRPIWKLRDWIDETKLDNSYLSRNLNAIDYLKKNPDKIDWFYLSFNPNAIELLKENLDKVNWFTFSSNKNALEIILKNLDYLNKNPKKINWQDLSSNENAIELLKQNQNKICYGNLSSNPAIFELDYEEMKKNNQDMYEELIKEVMKPSRVFKNPNYDYIEELFGD